MVLISDLPDVIFHYATASAVPPWLSWIKVAVLAAFFVLTMLWKKIRPLWQFAVVMAVFLLAIWVTSRIRGAPWWQQTFPVKNTSFYLGYIGLYILDIIVALSVIAGLWLIKKRRADFFLVKGDLRAPIEPIRWLGIGKGKSWINVGWVIALVAGVVVFFPTVLAVKPTGTDFARALPLLPGVLLFAAVNAFGEEVYFCLSFLSTLNSVIAKGHVLLISAAFFGLAHWLYGSPGGLVGFLMTGFLAWLLGKSILETRGMAWAWFIHFVPDVVVFLSYALLWYR
jgi:membrane protease YdiL (CAAX protease family)